MRYWFAGLGFLLLVAACDKAAAGPAVVEPGKPAYVKVAVLNARATPSQTAAKTGAFVLADRVEVLERSTAEETIGDYRGYWFRVQGVGKSGWVFGPFLSAEPVMTTAEVRKLVQGDFYYLDVGDDRHVKRTLRVKGERYEEFVYDSGVGLLDYYAGRIAFQADSIELFPELRRTREAPAGDGGDGEDGDSPYTPPTYDQNELVKVTVPAKVNEGRAKYFLFPMEDKVHLTTVRPLEDPAARRAQFDKLTWTYVRQ